LEGGQKAWGLNQGCATGEGRSYWMSGRQGVARTDFLGMARTKRRGAASRRGEERSGAHAWKVSERYPRT
jgi:hypothetical protein